METTLKYFSIADAKPPEIIQKKGRESDPLRT